MKVASVLCGVAILALAVWLVVRPFPKLAYSVFPVFATRSATVIFGGDMMFDRTIRTTIEAKGGNFIFSCLDEVLRDTDLVVANFEGPITDNPSKSVGSSVGGEGNYTFTFPTSTAALLYAHNIRLVNLGNNHILNYHDAGVLSTREALLKAGVGYFGDPLNHSVYHEVVHGVRLAFINYNEFDTDPQSAARGAAAEVYMARKNGELPIVYTHWGEEYQQANDSQRRLAHEFVDAGAEIVVGSHPHVIQDTEMYKGKYILYSLGNLFFDQYWDEDVRTGLLARVVFEEKGVSSVQVKKVYLKRDRRTCPVE